MYTWLGASLAWLLGTALQLMSEAPTRAACGLCLAFGSACLLLGVLARSWLRRRGRAGGAGGAARVAWRWPACHALAALGLATLAWGLTGWRALERLEQGWPADMAHQVVRADVRWEGLPQRTLLAPSSPRQRGRAGGRLDARQSGQQSVRPLVDAEAGGAATEPVLGDVAMVRWQAEARILRWLPPTFHPPGVAWPERVQLSWEQTSAEHPPRPGETWRVTMRLRTPDDRVNPGVGDGSLGRFGRGVRAVGRVLSVEGWPATETVPSASWLKGRIDAIDAWRQRVRDRISERVPDARAAGVLAGLAVGDQAAISRADWVVLQRTGTAHLVSISGTHVAMLGVLAAWLVRSIWARLPGLTRRLPAHTVATWVALVVSTLYAVAAGWGVPAQRTVWMMVFATVLGAVGRRWPWPLLWLPGAALVALTDPWALAQPGFWLSFVAVGVLLASGVRVPEAAADEWASGRAGGHWLGQLMKSWRDAGTELLQTQRLVAVALAPLALVCFQQVSIVGVAVNVLAVPLFTLVFTPLALAGVFLPFCWDAAAWGLQASWWALSTSAQAPGAVWTVPALPGWVAASGIAAAFVLALPGRWEWRVLAVPFLLPFFRLPDAWHLLPRPQPGEFSAVVVDVGQGGAILVRTSSHTLLFDAGPLRPDGSDLVDRVLAPMLQSLGVHRLDALVISHDDADHSGGARSLLEGIEVGQLMTPFDADHPLRRHPVAHRGCEAGLTWTWDGVVFRMLHPGPVAPNASDNARSCVLQVEAMKRPASASLATLAAWGGASEDDASKAGAREPVRLLLTADIEAEQERALLTRWPTAVLRSTVMLVPHHGSRTSSTPAWLSAVAPRQAVVQVGERNAYGHPSPAVMRRYAQAGIPVVTTPACGAFVWESRELIDDRPAEAALADGTDKTDSADRTHMPAEPLNKQRNDHSATTKDPRGPPVLGRCWRATRSHHWQQ